MVISVIAIYLLLACNNRSQDKYQNSDTTQKSIISPDKDSQTTDPYQTTLTISKSLEQLDKKRNDSTNDDIDWVEFLNNVHLDYKIEYNDDFEPTVLFSINNETVDKIKSIEIRMNKCPDYYNKPQRGINCEELFILKGPFKAKSTTTKKSQIHFDANKEPIFLIDKILSEKGNIYRRPIQYSNN